VAAVRGTYVDRVFSALAIIVGLALALIVWLQLFGLW
jgi:hypothetical protein